MDKVKKVQQFFDALRDLTPGERIEIEKQEHDTFFKYFREGHYTISKIPNEVYELEFDGETVVSEIQHLMEKLDTLEGLKP